MIRFERTFDAALVRRAIANPKTYKWHTCDGSPAIEDYQPSMGANIFYAAAWDGDEYLGCFKFEPLNPILWEVHTCLLPSSWGDRAHQAAVDCAAWIFANTPCRHIITHVPEDNALAAHLAVGSGFTVYGTIPASLPRGGKLLAQTLFGRVA